MSDRLTIQDGEAHLVTDEGQEVSRSEEDFVRMIREETEPPIHRVAWPDGLKFCEWSRPFLCVVHQMPPHIRQLRWITDDSPVPFGPGATFQTRRLSIPYAITFAVFGQHRNRLTLLGYNELYFRNKPLKTRSDALGYPALLNVSRIDVAGRSRAWICTQHLAVRPDQPWDAQLAALLDHTWNGGFNRSSEHHEGASWYGQSQGIHPDLHPIDRWEQATARSEAFGLSVPWSPVPLNVGQLMSAVLDECHQDTHQGLLCRRLGESKTIGLATRFLNFAQRPAAT